MTTLPRVTYFACMLHTAFCMGAYAQTTAFSYQGQLTDNGSPANGLYDLRFELYDADTLSTSLGVVTNAATAITNGLFTVTLDFGSGVFDGSERWLHVGAVTNGGGAFSTLSPRQPITSTPYAVRAANSASAEAVSGTVDASQLTGTVSSNNIGTGSITSVMLANGAVGTEQLADEAVTAGKILSTSDWFLTRSLFSPAPQDSGRFGVDVEGVSSDTVLIGEVFQGSGGAAHLLGADGSPLSTILSPSFVRDVAAVGAGAVLIGADGDNTGGSFFGAAYLIGTNGTLTTTYTNPTPQSSDQFGFAVAAVSSEAVLIGAVGDDTGATNAGAAYLFSTNGSLLTTFTNPTPASSDRFGYAVAGVASDTVLIGADLDNTGANHAGAAYLFSTNGVLLTTITNPTPASSDRFGSAVAAVSLDAVLIGALGDDTGANNAGAAYLFGTNGTLLTTFTNPTPEVGENFGHAVAAVGPDKVLIGAWRDNAGADEAGAAYLFGTNGTLLTTITNPTPEIQDHFGFAVAGVGPKSLVIGAFRDDTLGSDAGAAYLYEMRTYTPGLVAEAVPISSIGSSEIADGSVSAADLSSSVGLWVASGSDVYRNGGKVGIGTTAPEGDLHIRGNSTTGSIVITPNTANNQSQILLAENTTASLGMILRYAGDEAANPLHFIGWNSDVEGSPLLTIERNGGNVGIGTNNPSQKLHVIGGVSATAFTGDGSGLSNLTLPAIPDGHSLDALDGSPADAILVDAVGHVGIGTTSPGARLEVAGGNFLESAIRHRSSSNGNTNAWDVGQRVISSTDSYLSFENSGTLALALRNSGQVGIGTTAPEGDLHIRGNGTTGSIVVTPNAANNQSQILLAENTTASLGMILRYAGDEAANPLHVVGWNGDVEGSPLLTIERNGGDVGIGISNPTEKLHVVGNILATGTITPSSDRNLKKNFDAVDAQEVLARVAALPIQRWTYKTEENSVRHVGPMAQDFHATFGLGANDTTIATVDADGVALAAIQGLNQKLEQKDARIAKMERELSELKQLVSTIMEKGNR